MGITYRFGIHMLEIRLYCASKSEWIDSDGADVQNF